MSVLWTAIYTYDCHVLGVDEGVEGPVGDDLAAVGAAVDEGDAAQPDLQEGQFNRNFLSWDLAQESEPSQSHV